MDQAALLSSAGLARSRRRKRDRSGFSTTKATAASPPIPRLSRWSGRFLRKARVGRRPVTRWVAPVGIANIIKRGKADFRDVRWCLYGLGRLDRRPSSGQPPLWLLGNFYALTPHLKPAGEKNILSVRVRNEGKNSRWYSGSGIYRHVTLTTTHPLCIAQWGVVITTPQVSKTSAMVKVEMSLGTPARLGVMPCCE